jgi:predicted RNA-binding Zn-ribbon protein involved in translation (DUF1610 family)
MGQLAILLQKYDSTWRWMGCNIAVYDVTSPRESAMKGRKVPGPTRGLNRRGRRSTRGGKKRRALAGAAPETTRPPPSESRVLSRSLKRKERHANYSKILVAYFTKLQGQREAMKRAVSSSSGVLDVDLYQQRKQKFQRTVTRLRRSWFLQAKLPGESPLFTSLRFRALSIGIDEFYREAVSKAHSRVLREIRSDWYGELLTEIPVTVFETREEEKARGLIYRCNLCNRSTNIKVCRLCGGELAPLNHPRYKGKNWRPVRKNAPAPVEATSSSKVTERKSVQFGSDGRFACPNCHRRFRAADGHSVKRCKPRS